MKARIITAVILLPLLLLVLLFCPKIVAAVLLGLMAAIAAYELAIGTGYVKSKGIGACCCFAAMITVLCCYFDLPDYCGILLLLLLWILLFGWSMYTGMKLSFEAVAVCFAAGLLVPYLLAAIIRIYKADSGRVIVLIPFVLAFMSDTGAYFIGKAFGKHKLAPNISPKKTVEGVIGGVLGAVAGMLIFTAVLKHCFGYQVSYIYGVIYGALGSVAAVFGDLCFSLIKRQRGIKDYGYLFPGHGGVLDRFDSMVIVAPLSELMLIILPLAVKL